MHHSRVVKFSMFFCFLFFVWSRVCFLLGDKQEAKFRGVMSTQKHSLQTQDLTRLGFNFIYIYIYIFIYIYDLVLITFLIFSFIGFL